MIQLDEDGGYLIPVPRVVTVSELAAALNAIGATPTDLIAIFNALKKAGALQAKLENYVEKLLWKSAIPY